MKIGLLVEGPSDKQVIRALAQRVLEYAPGRRTGLEPRAVGSHVRSFDGIRHHMTALLKLHRDVSKVIVCADLHSDPVKKREIENTENALVQGSLPVPVKYVKVLHALEGWLLADPNALQQTLGPNATLGKIPGNLESRCDQVEILEELFRKNGKEYKKVRWAPTLASHADPSAIAARMSSFQEFLDALKDP